MPTLNVSDESMAVIEALKEKNHYDPPKRQIVDQALLEHYKSVTGEEWNESR